MKKFFGIKIGKIVTAILCLIVAVIFWFIVEYSRFNASDLQAFATFCMNA